MKKIVDILKNYYYHVMIESKLSKINFFELKRIAEEYNKVQTFSVGEDYENDEIVDHDSIENMKLYSANNGGMDIYYKNVHVSIVDNDKQHIVRISIKKENDEWVFKKNNKTFNTTSPITETMSVYLYYNVNVMDDRFCENVNYMGGNWNNYIYNAVMDINDMIYGFTQYSQFSKDYGKK